MDPSLEYVAHEAVGKVYSEYLADRYKTDQLERLRRGARYEDGNPHPKDVAALNSARQAYLDSHGSDAAIEAARDALRAQFDREKIFQRTVDRNRYFKEPEYHVREKTRVDEEVEARRQARLEQVQTTPERELARGNPSREEQPVILSEDVKSKLNQELDTEEDHEPSRHIDRDKDPVESSRLNESFDREERAEEDRSARPIEVSASDRLQFSKLNRMLDHEEQDAMKDHGKAGRNGIESEMNEAKREIASRTLPDRTPGVPQISR